MTIKAPPRRVESFELAGFDTLHVRALYVPEMFKLEKSAQGITDDFPELCALQLAAYFCDASGNDALTLDEARELVAHLEINQLKALLAKGQALNTLTDAAVEAERKNS